jgi:hypothetical protein
MSDASSSDAGVPNGSQGVGRRSLLRGLAATGAVVAVSGALSIASETPASAADQPYWAWCYKCQGLWYTNADARLYSVICPSQAQPYPGQHNNTGSGNYTLFTDGPGQRGWRFCRKCLGLWFAYNGTGGRCPANSSSAGHTLEGSGDYGLAQGGNVGVNEQVGWFWCSRCQGLWYGLNNTTGVCPAGGGHTNAGSGSYHLFKS